MSDSERLVSQLNELSSPYLDPLAQLRRSEVATDTWWLPPDALSLSRVPEFDALPIGVRHRLSQLEFARMLDAGLWLESLFIERFGRAAGSEPRAAVRARYLHEIREEAGHSLMFLELLERSGLDFPDAARVRSAPMTLVGRILPFSGALFWTLTLIGEELGDRLTRRIPRGTQEVTISAFVYHLARIHVRDEARHIAHTRAECEEACRRLPHWRRKLASPVVRQALHQLARLLYYPPSSLYAAAGLPEAIDWRGRALANQARAAFAFRAVQPTIDFLSRIGWDIGVNPFADG